MFSARLFRVCVLTASLFAFACRAAAVEPSFKAPLDGELAGGQVADAPIPFAAGISGEAATVGVSDERQFRCTWDAEERIPAGEGTISLWVKPLDWDAEDPHHQVFFSATGENSVLHIYRYNDVGAQSGFSRKLLFLYGPSQRSADGKWQWTIASSAEAREWETEQWHHIACTWREDKMVLFLDGRVADTKDVSSPAATGFTTFGIGGTYRWENAGGTSLVDELTIFHEAISAADVYAEWSAHAPESVATPGDGFGIDYIYTDLEARTLNIGLRQPFPVIDGHAPTARVRLVTEDGQTELERSFGEAEYAYEVAMPVGDLAPEDYGIQVSFTDPDGVALDEFSEPYTKYAAGPAPWDGNTIGITDRVPEPWTDVEVVGEEVRCSGRTYDFGGGALPTSITSQESELLHSPVRLSGILGGQSAELQTASVRSRRVSPKEAVVDSSGALGPVEARCQARVEYDGFAWFSMTLEPDTPTEVSELTLEIPLEKDAATLRNLGRYRLEGTGAMPASGSFYKNLADRPIFWLGNESVGLQWFAETLQGWHLHDFDRALEVVIGRDATTARLHIIDMPTVLERPLTIAFGLQATPVRPKPEGWRQWRLRPWRDSRAEFNIRPWFTKWTELFNYPRPSHVDAERIAQRREYEAKGTRVLSYLSLTHASPYSPEFRYFGERWRQTPQPRVLENTALDPQTRIWANYTVCARDASYRDFYLWMLDTAIREYDITGGLYFDQARPEMCRNRLHGCGWTDPHGNQHGTFNVLGTRELAERIYVMMQEYSPDALIAHHMSGEVTMPVNAFSEMLIDGENLTGAVGLAGNYYEALPPDTFRAEYMHYQWGPVPALLPQHARSASILKGREEELYFYEADAAQKPIDYLLGLVTVHDGFIWPAWEVQPSRLWSAQDEFGWDDRMEVIPYWRSGEAVEVLAPEGGSVLVTAYRRPGRVMLVPLNTSDQRVTVKLRMDCDGLGLPAGEPIPLEGLYHGEDFTITGGVTEFALPARGFRMLASP